MDEAIRIYIPTKQYDNKILYNPGASINKSESKSKWKSYFDLDIMKDVINKQVQKTKKLNEKYIWFSIVYNWLIVFVMAALFVSFIIWGVNIRTENIAVAYAKTVAAEKDAEHQAYIDQQEAIKKAQEESIENLMLKNAQIKAKVAYGSRNFIDKWHYGDNDFMTLFQCIDNRLKNSMYQGMSIEEIAFQEGQFIASYNSNPVQDYYLNLALKSEQKKNASVSEAVGSDYVYTIYTEHGIYLTNDPNAPAYTWWHYSE